MKQVCATPDMVTFATNRREHRGEHRSQTWHGATPATGDVDEPSAKHKQSIERLQAPHARPVRPVSFPAIEIFQLVFLYGGKPCRSCRSCMLTRVPRGDSGVQVVCKWCASGVQMRDSNVDL